ncbi:uncharacterized protein LOC110838746 isoform X2 [Zootermopsis nevadensis]|uniref:uncharacterized protein LOC110838746 isoform X2 n=1 Tax=Zootermopsis nevadensis TaxID=136037 RepID=UPI000B8E339B|nr:uncharacterized protein LOC110838746 isoform X2 [Zootermopsis nevadensis]
MDSFQGASIFDISDTAERCFIGYEALFRQTKLKIGYSCYFTPGSFLHIGMENHGSDADDEVTDVSGEYHNSSNELSFVPNEYYISSGSKPLSLVIRRCSIPTTENSFSSVLKRHSVGSSPFTKESKITSNSEVLNLEREVNDSHFQKEVRITCNAINSNVEEFDNCLVSSSSGVGVRGLQEVILSSSQESSHSVVTHEYMETVINGNALREEICGTRNDESGLNCYYTHGSTLLQSKPLFKNCRSDNADVQHSVSPFCCRVTCGMMDSATIDNKNQHSPHPLENSENTLSLIQKGELIIHRLFEGMPGRNIVESTVRITENEGCQEINSVDTSKYELNIPATVMLDNDVLHMNKYSEYAVNMNDLNLKTQSETFSVGGESVVESTVMESPVNKICEAEGISIVGDSLKFQSSESALLHIKVGDKVELHNQTERGSEVSTIICHNTDVSVGRNLFDEEDHTAHTEESGDIESSEVSFDGSRTSLQIDTLKSETQNKIVHKPDMLQKIDHSVEKIKANTLQHVSVSPTLVGCAQSSPHFQNSENSVPVINTENKQTLSVDDDIHVQKCMQYSFDNEGELRTESGVCYNSKYPISSVGPNAFLISGDITKEQSVNIKTVNDMKTKVTKNLACSSVLVDESSENIVEVASADCHRDQFFKASKTDVSQSHSSSVLLQLHTEVTLECSYNNVSSDAVYVEHSPLLFSSDDEKSYYTEADSNELETIATTSNYDKINIIEQKRLHQLQEALQGVPPPPSVTIPQLNVTDILRLLKENESLMITVDAETEDSKKLIGKEAVESQKAPLIPSFVEQVNNSSWPESKYCCYHGIQKSEHRQKSKNNHPHKQVSSADCNRLQQTKRALFKSPPNKHQRISSSSESRSGSKKNKSDIDRTRVQNSKRALWPSTSKDNAPVKSGDDGAFTNLSGQTSVYGKRTREESGMPAQYKKCPRRMLFVDGAVKGKSDFKSQRVRTSENKPQVSSVSRDLTGGLSDVHRKKLLWAVAEALRAEGISMSHPLFRPSAASLARLVLNVMPDLKCRQFGSTSDIMLQLAREHIKDVIKEQQLRETKVKKSI